MSKEVRKEELESSQAYGFIQPPEPTVEFSVCIDCGVELKVGEYDRCEDCWISRGLIKYKEFKKGDNK